MGLNLMMYDYFLISWLLKWQSQQACLKNALVIVAEEQLWAVLYKLCKWKTAAALQSASVQTWAGGEHPKHVGIRISIYT